VNLTTWDRFTSVYGRGDYGADDAPDLVDLVERWNCVDGCVSAGDEATRAEWGPGGNCPLLVNLFAELPVPEFEPRPDRIHCTARVPLAAEAVLDGQEVLDL
jgi:hypothetical protein